MSARHRFPGTDAGDSTVLTFDSIDVVQDDDKYKKKNSGLLPSSWSTSSLTNKLSSFTATAINNINQTIVANTGPPGTVGALHPVHSYPSLSTSSQGVTDSLEPSLYDQIFGLKESEQLVVMASRDRTNEFANAIRSMQGRNIQRAVNIRDPRKAKQMQSYSEFMGVAKLVGRNIASTYTKLEKLTLRKWTGLGRLTLY